MTKNSYGLEMGKFDYAKLCCWYVTFVLWYWNIGFMYGMIAYLIQNQCLLILLSKLLGLNLVDP